MPPHSLFCRRPTCRSAPCGWPSHRPSCCYPRSRNLGRSYHTRSIKVIRSCIYIWRHRYTRKIVNWDWGGGGIWCHGWSDRIFIFFRCPFNLLLMFKDGINRRKNWIQPGPRFGQFRTVLTVSDIGWLENFDRATLSLSLCPDLGVKDAQKTKNEIDDYEHVP